MNYIHPPVQGGGDLLPNARTADEERADSMGVGVITAPEFGLVNGEPGRSDIRRTAGGGGGRDSQWEN